MAVLWKTGSKIRHGAGNEESEVQNEMTFFVTTAASKRGQEEMSKNGDTSLDFLCYSDTVESRR